MAEPAEYRFAAVGPDGRRRKGVIAAPDAAAAFEQLRRDGFSPTSLRPLRAAQPTRTNGGQLRQREAAEFLSSLAELLRAGADIRTALSILGSRFERPAVRVVCEQLAAAISGGEALERAFAARFEPRYSFVAPLVAAGEATGDLPGGLQRAGDILTSRLKLRDQLVSVLAYPSFVFVSAIAAVFVILLFIVPTIAPLAEEAGGEPPAALAALLQASTFLKASYQWLLVGALGGLIGLLLAARAQLLSRVFERLLLDGFARRTVAGIVFGAFAVSLGTMLAAGAPISDALRLAIRTTPYSGARRRLEPVMADVREGQTLSEALIRVAAFPPALIRLVAVGEASNMVGPMLMRAGRLEEEAALKRIEIAGQLAGPALIVLLGALLGVLMGGLLSGVSQMGQAALG